MRCAWVGLAVLGFLMACSPGAREEAEPPERIEGMREVARRQAEHDWWEIWESIEPPADVDSWYSVTDGVPTLKHETVGALLIEVDGLPRGTECTGILIGCETFLTAAHCFKGRSKDLFNVYLPHIGILPVRDYRIHGEWQPERFAAADVAVAQIDRVSGVTASALAEAGPRPGSDGEIVGFGWTLPKLRDSGIKRVGPVVTESCRVAGEPALDDDRFACWRYDPEAGASGANTCNLDSGGPLFVGGAIAGVTSDGTVGCVPGDVAFNARVAHYAGWIESAATWGSGSDADLGSRGCSIPRVAEAYAKTDSVEADVAFREYAFDLPGLVGTLRVAFNGVESPGVEFDYQVVPPPGSDLEPCIRRSRGQYAFCSFPTPPAGEWRAVVERVSGSGQFQLVATAIP